MSTGLPTQVDLNEVRRAYEELDNYRVWDRPARYRSGGCLRCVVFFSSHGIYYPNTDREVQERIFRQDRYEWRQNVPGWADRVVFLRDVQKQWFIEGVNSRINSPAGVLQLLRDQTAGYNTMCVGASAGGYAATLFGCLLGVERVVSFSGQFSLEEFTERYPGKNPLLEKYGHDSSAGRHVSLVPLLLRSATPVFHLYSRAESEDVLQVALAHAARNLFTFPFRYGSHGVPCYLVNCVDLFGLPHHKLVSLSGRIRESDISPLAFSLRVSGWRKTMPYAIHELRGRLKKRDGGDRPTVGK